MLPLEHADRIQITFDDHRLVANAGLLLPATLAQRLGLPELVDRRLDLGNALGRANTGDKIVTLVASALAGGDCIDDADVLRTGGTAGVIGCVVKAPSTLGTFLRSFRWGHVRYGGARGQLTVRADSGFYTHAIVAVCRKMEVRFSITVRQHKSLRNLIEAIPETDWTPIPYWMDGAAAVAEATYTPFQSEPDAAPVRLIVRRVKPTPGSQLALFATYSYHACITDLDGQPWHWRPTIGATPRSRMPFATSSPASGSTISPRAASPPTLPGWPSRCSPTTSHAGRRASVWASQW